MDGRWRRLAAAVLVAGALSGCDKPRPADWMKITQGDGGESGAFYLDRANLSVKGGTPYVILQTRYADGRTGSIRAEVNCPRQKLEPTALKEDVFGKDGALLQNRMTTLSADDEKAILQYACAKR
jgi:hypothetical protein